MNQYHEYVHFPKDYNAAKQEKILVAARRVRAWAESERIRYEAGPCLTGMCAIASGRLWMLLKQHNIHARLIMAIQRDAECHVYVDVDGLVVDVTASQFGEDEIVVIDGYERTEWYWKPHYIFPSVLDLRVNQIDTKWVPQQIAVVFEELES